MTNRTTISINYSDERLRILVEEYITQQRKEFTFKGLCSYIFYWAMEDGKTVNCGNAIYDSYQMSSVDCDRVCSILESIVKDGRLVKTTDNYQLAN